MPHSECERLILQSPLLCLLCSVQDLSHFATSFLHSSQTLTYLDLQAPGQTRGRVTASQRHGAPGLKARGKPLSTHRPDRSPILALGCPSSLLLISVPPPDHQLPSCGSFPWLPASCPVWTHKVSLFLQLCLLSRFLLPELVTHAQTPRSPRSPATRLLGFAPAWACAGLLRVGPYLAVGSPEPGSPCCPQLH